MTDPERLLHGSAGALSARLLRAGHDEAPPRRSLERTLAAVGVATTALGTAGTAGALGSTAGAGAAATLGAGAVGTAGGVGALGAAGKAATTLTLLGIAKWAGVGVASGVAVSLAAHGIETRAAASRGAVAAPSHVAVTAGTATSVVASAAAEATHLAGTAPLAHDGRENAASSPAATDPRIRRKPPSSTRLAAPLANVEDATNAPLAAEVTFVDRGRALFQRGDARGALAALAGYEREFPERRLLPEVLFLRMEASNAAGDSVRAQTFARVIVREYGKSPHAARARALLGEHPASQP